MSLITTSPRFLFYVDIAGVRYILNSTLSGKPAINVLCEGANLFFYRGSGKTWCEVASDKPAKNIIAEPLAKAFKILKKLEKEYDIIQATAN